MKKYFIFAGLLFTLISCAKETNSSSIIETPEVPEIPTDTMTTEDNIGNVDPDKPNVLFIIADDIGLDALNGFSERSIKPNTPNLDKLMNEGLRFTDTWTNSVCSPTRATILTGKYGYNNGVRTQSDLISTHEVTLHSYISDDYANALIGKWHLSGGGRGAINPEIMDIDYYAGVIGGGVADYYDWDLSENDGITPQTQYVTEKLTDIAIEWTGQQTQPWFLWLAYNAPHTPFHVPPSYMHSQGSLSNDENTINNDPLPYYLAAIEAMDFQMGRLLESLSAKELANTTIIFIGDNGTPGQVVQTPFRRGRAKGSLYQGGVNCPMIISGAKVERTGTESSIINSSDLFATIATLTGTNTTEIHNSKDFSSLLTSTDSFDRQYTYSEYKDDIDDEYTIRNSTHKLIVIDGVEELYNLSIDPYEGYNLMDAELSDVDQLVKDVLLLELQNIRN